MIEFYKNLIAELESGRRLAMGTLVNASGSTPQKPGARALFYPDGRIFGTLGGGCLEMEARRRALQSLRTGRPEFFDLQLDDDFGWDDGLICGGTARIFVGPLHLESVGPYRALIQAVELRRPAVLAMVVDAPDGAGLGATLAATNGRLVAADALPDSLRDRVLDTALGLLADRGSRPKGRPLDGLSGVTAYFEPVFPRARLLIVGAGHIGQALGHLAQLLDFEVHVLDDRPDFANEARFPDAASLRVCEVAAGVREFTMGDDAYVVILTRGHRHDGIALRECIHAPAAYLGMIGSRRKVRVIFDAMLRDGFATPEELERVHAPVGLDIGSQSVQEIAVSIAAQLIQVRSGMGVGREPVAMPRPRIAAASGAGEAER